MPAGPGGAKPTLTLSYNSQANDGPQGRRSRSRADWLGLGWSLETGSIGLIKSYNQGQTLFSLSLDGKTYQMVPGAKRAGNVGDYDPDPTHREWHTSDESFLKVTVAQNGVSVGNQNGVPTRGARLGDTWLPRYTWTIWTQDNTRYEFSEDLWQGFDNCDTPQQSVVGQFEI